MSLQSLNHLEMKSPEKGGKNQVTQFVSNSNLPIKAFSSGGGRHAVRQRYIQHKKMSMMDSKALDEVSRFQPFSCAAQSLNSLRY